MPPKAFFAEKDTFDLTVTLNDNTLYVELKNYVTFQVNSIKCTKQMLGVELEKIMMALDRSLKFEENKNIFYLSHYEFGKGLPDDKYTCYKVYPQKLTVYVPLTEDIYQGNKDTYYAVQQVQIPLKFRQKIIGWLISEKADIVNETNRLLYLNKAFKSEALLESAVSCEITNFKNLNKYLNFKLEKKTKQIKSKVDLRLKELQYQVTNPNYHSSIFYHLSEQYPFLKFTPGEKKPTFTPPNIMNLTPLDDKEMKRKIKQLQIKQNFVNLPQKNTSFFTFNRLKLQALSGSLGPRQYIFNRGIMPNERYKFKLKVISMKQFGMIIGVVDYLSQKDKTNSFQSGNAFGYSCEGYIFPSFSLAGAEFKQGDVVQVDLNRSTGKIMYTINGLLQMVEKNVKFMGNKCLYMPYVEMMGEKDTVQWILQDSLTF